MSADRFVELATGTAAVLLFVAVICAGIRIVRGPHSADRVVALDLLCLLGVSAAVLAALGLDAALYLDIALGVALIGFLATVAFARFIERGAIFEEQDQETER